MVLLLLSSQKCHKVVCASMLCLQALFLSLFIHTATLSLQKKIEGVISHFIHIAHSEKDYLHTHLLLAFVHHPVTVVWGLSSSLVYWICIGYFVKMLAECSAENLDWGERVEKEHVGGGSGLIWLEVINVCYPIQFTLWPKYTTPDLCVYCAVRIYFIYFVFCKSS